MYNQEIVKRVANADLKAFRKMYIDCAPSIYDCAFENLRDVVRANMVVTRTFVDVFHYLPQLKQLSMFDEWVYRLTVYHADNIALEDFIRGSQKLETIWRDILNELGIADPQKAAKSAPVRPQTARPMQDLQPQQPARGFERQEEQINLPRTTREQEMHFGAQEEHPQPERTDSLYRRLQAIEDEARAMHDQGAANWDADEESKNGEAFEGEAVYEEAEPFDESFYVKPQKGGEFSIGNPPERQFSANWIEERSLPDADSLRAADEEEWTPILFPTDEAVEPLESLESPDEEEHTTGKLRAVRKTVLMPVSRAYAVARPKDEALVADEAVFPSDEPPYTPAFDARNEERANAEPSRAEAFKVPAFYASVVVQQEDERWDEPAPRQADDPEAEKKNQTVERQQPMQAEKPEPQNAFLSGSAAAVRLQAANNDQFERFRAFLDQTRTAERASAPPPDERVQEEADAYEQTDEHAQKTKGSERKARKQDKPKARRGRGVLRTILAILLVFVVVVVLPLVLMALNAFSTPVFLRGPVAFTAAALQRLSNTAAEVGAYLSNLS